MAGVSPPADLHVQKLPRVAWWRVDGAGERDGVREPGPGNSWSWGWGRDDARDSWLRGWGRGTGQRVGGSMSQATPGTGGLLWPLPRGHR